jgi:hypothetical protein
VVAEVPDHVGAALSLAKAYQQKEIAQYETAIEMLDHHISIIGMLV